MPNWRVNIPNKPKEKKPALGEFIGCDYESLKHDYPSLPSIDKIIYAFQDDEDYSGLRTIIWKDGDQFYIVSDSHCSCNGWNDNGNVDAQFRRPELHNKATRAYIADSYPDALDVIVRLGL